jgi:hypothetical protein
MAEEQYACKLSRSTLDVLAWTRKHLLQVSTLAQCMRTWPLQGAYFICTQCLPFLQSLVYPETHLTVFVGK